MIIINDKPGQLSNRLWVFSFFVAYAMKHGVSVYIPHFREYRPYFDDLSIIPHVHFTVMKKPRVVDFLAYHGYRAATRFLRIISICCSLEIFRIYLDPKHWTRESWEMSLLEKKKSIIFLGSWFAPKEVTPLLEYKDVLLKLFKPKRLYKENVDTMFGNLRSRYDMIIGVHIRRQDYAGFHGGAYLFDDAAYNTYMKMIKGHAGSRTTCFFLSSDEKIDPSAFNEFEIASLNAPAAIEDLYALSQCDYILGPPSTFSMWASFAGDVPLRIVTRSDEELSLDQFSPILYQNVFKNGKRFQHLDENADSALHAKSFLV